MSGSQRSGTASARELRAQLRHWRRGRAEVSLGQVLSDAYVAVFSTVVLGAMGISALLETRAFAGIACTSPHCTAARAAAPALSVLGLVAACLWLCRLLGPMLVTPAVGSWLLAAPVDRRDLLRPRLLATFAASFVGAGLVASPLAVVAGLGPAAVVGTGVVAASCGSATVALCVLAQPVAGPRVGAANAVVAATLWCGLVLVVADPSGLVAGAAWPAWDGGATLAGSASVVVAVVLAVVADRTLPKLGRVHLAPGGSLAPSLSGALSGLDMALVHDILLARRWRLRSRVRPVRRMPRRLGTGAPALITRDLLRLRRAPVTVVALAASLVLPHLVTTLGGGRVTVLVGATTGFLAGTSLFPALRVLVRTPGLIRSFPQSATVLKAATMTVPGAVLVLWGVATAPALHASLDVGWGTAVAAGGSVGLLSVAAATWWLTAPLPDYQMPLVSSPAGGVPPALLLAATRGFDVVLLGALPLLVLPPLAGAATTALVAAGVVWWRLVHD